MQELDYHAAFADFMQHVYPIAFPEGKRFGKDYNRVRQAVHASEGKGQRRLTAEWVARILEDYQHLAPGRYRIERGVKIYVEK